MLRDGTDRHIEIVLSFSLRSVACLKLSIKSHSHVSIVGIYLANAIHYPPLFLESRLRLDLKLLCSRYQFNDFLAKDEDEEGDTCPQTCTFIGHRVCNIPQIRTFGWLAEQIIFLR